MIRLLGMFLLIKLILNEFKVTRKLLSLIFSIKVIFVNRQSADICHLHFCCHVQLTVTALLHSADSYRVMTIISLLSPSRLVQAKAFRP